jgi:hypothetical protein
MFDKIILRQTRSLTLNTGDFEDVHELSGLCDLIAPGMSNPMRGKVIALFAIRFWLFGEGYRPYISPYRSTFCGEY